MKIVLIIPVYNEAESLGEFLPKLKKYVELIQRHEIYILIFNSNSTDSTSQIIEESQKKWDKLLSLQEKYKSGLGSAYLQGMNYAINVLNADAVFQCDADGSHDPQYIDRMINLLEEGYDVIIGSRYIKGGKIDANWAWYRRKLSSLGNCLARTVLSRRYKDYTSGFRLIRSSILKPLLTKKFFSKQFAFQINLLWDLHKNNAKIIETPILFTDREKGYSKFPRHNIIESLYVLMMLRIRDIQKYVKMCCCGLGGLLMQIILFNILRKATDPVIANIISIEVAIIFNFISNNYFSFSNNKLQKKHGLKLWSQKFSYFLLISHGSMLFQTGILFLGTHYWLSSVITDNLLVLTGVFMGSILNYFLYKKIVWKKPVLNNAS